jgi:penicillin-binding protein 1A
LASAYATFANGGRRVTPYALRYARTQSGDLVYRHPAIDERSAAGGPPYCELMSMLRHVTSPDGTGRAASVDRPVWGKTGTSSGYRDALFVGFTGRYVAVVWLGRQAAGAVSGRVTGGELPAQTFGWLVSTLEAGSEPVGISCEAPTKVALK